MKILSFYSEKGGMGKTTFTALFASWLAYVKKEKVIVLDFDFPGYQMYNMRNIDSILLQNGDPKLTLLVGDNKPYKVERVMAKSKGYTDEQLKEIVTNMRKLKEKPDGYVLCDFPGSFLKNGACYQLINERLIDLVVFPIDTDRQSVSSMLNIFYIMNDPSKMPGLFSRKEDLSAGKEAGVQTPLHAQKVLALWNKETQNERSKGNRDWYGPTERLLKQMGIPICRTRMRNIEILRRDPPTFGFIRNTVCWPSDNVKQRCPYIEDIFDEIKARLDGSWEEE